MTTKVVRIKERTEWTAARGRLAAELRGRT